MFYLVKDKTYYATIKHVNGNAGFTKPCLQIMCCNCPYACFMLCCCYFSVYRADDTGGGGVGVMLAPTTFFA